jgi:hypothetical protein
MNFSGGSIAQNSCPEGLQNIHQIQTVGISPNEPQIEPDIDSGLCGSEPINDRIGFVDNNISAPVLILLYMAI